MSGTESTDPEASGTGGSEPIDRQSDAKPTDPRPDAETAETTDRSALGVRDRVLVLPSVICSHVVAERIADNVEGCIAAPHDHGCAQLGRDNDRTRDTLLALGSHPNVAGTVVVGLGCEHVQSDSLAATLEERGVEVHELSIQGVGGTEACVEQGTELARSLRERTAVDLASPSLSDLTVGIVGTDLAASTREDAGPLVGAFADRVIEAGGQVLVTGSERVAAHPSAVRDRLADDAEGDLEAALDDVLRSDRQGPSRTPRLRSRAGECDAETATREWGTAPIDAILRPSERPDPDVDVGFVDSPSRFEEAATALVASGAHLVVHVTADGIPTGHPIAPVVKVSASDGTLAALGDDIDVDARRATVADLEDVVCDVAGGSESRTERHGVTTFAIERVGPSM